MRIKETTSVVLMVSTLGSSLAVACDEKSSEESKSCRYCKYGRDVFRVIGFVLGTFIAISSDNVNKLADDLNGDIFDVTRRGYFIHHRKESFIFPTTFALMGGCIGGFVGDLFGKLLLRFLPF